MMTTTQAATTRYIPTIGLDEMTPSQKYEIMLSSLRGDDYFHGLTLLESETTHALSPEQRLGLIRAAVARLQTERNDRPGQAKALAGVATVLELVQRGDVSPDAFTGVLGAEFSELVNVLSSEGDLSAVVDDAGTYGVPPPLRGLIAKFAAESSSLSEISDAVFDSRRLDPVFEGDVGETAAPPSRFSPPTATVPPTQQSHGIDAAVQLVGTIELEMDSVIQSLEQAGNGASQSTLASLKARMDLIKARMDIALALLDQMTSLFEKVGQAYGR